MLNFLEIAEKQGFLNDNTAQGRRTACVKLLSVLEPGQRTTSYVRANLDTIKARFQNLNKEVRGGTIDEYGRRLQLVLSDYELWSTDRAAWEKKASARGAKVLGDDNDKRGRLSLRPSKQKPSAPVPNLFADRPDARTVSFPLRPDFEVTVSLPKDLLTMAELRRLAWFLLPYAADFDPGTTSPRAVFQMLEPGERS